MTIKQIIVVLGMDEAKKAHAAKFDIAQAEVVRKASGLMGFRTAIPKSDEAIALSDRLPPGKLFTAGRGMIPFCKAETYQKLLAAVELEPEPEPIKDTTSPAKPAPALPKAAGGDPWAALKVGDRVVALESPDLGWWAAVISAASPDGKNLTLRWIDAPKAPPVVRKRRAVALLSNG